jgi:hypothetical protein
LKSRQFNVISLFLVLVGVGIGPDAGGGVLRLVVVDEILVLVVHLVLVLDVQVTLLARQVLLRAVRVLSAHAIGVLLVVGAFRVAVVVEVVRLVVVVASVVHRLVISLSIELVHERRRVRQIPRQVHELMLDFMNVQFTEEGTIDRVLYEALRVGGGRTDLDGHRVMILLNLMRLLVMRWGNNSVSENLSVANVVILSDGSLISVLTVASVMHLLVDGHFE